MSAEVFFKFDEDGDVQEVAHHELSVELLRQEVDSLRRRLEFLELTNGNVNDDG